jgi:MFS family permease
VPFSVSALAYLPCFFFVFFVLVVVLVVLFVFRLGIVVVLIEVVGVVIQGESVEGKQRRNHDTGSTAGLGFSAGGAGTGAAAGAALAVEYVDQKWRPHRGQTQN